MLPQDTTTLDSLRKRNINDSLGKIATAFKMEYHPRILKPDSARLPYTLSSYEIYKSDNIDLSGIIRMWPTIIGIDYAQSFANNRFLPYGFIAGSSGGTSISPTTTGGTDNLFSTEIATCSRPTPFDVSVTAQPQSVVTPHTDVFWENGVFNENILGIRFVRPLARTVTFALFSNYRYFEGRDFDHGNGDVYSFYEQTFGDSTRIMNNWRTCQINEQMTGIRLEYRPSPKTKLGITYRYTDMHDQLVLEKALESGLHTLIWKPHTQYGNFAQATVSQSFGQFGLNAQLTYNADLIRLQRTGTMDSVSYAGVNTTASVDLRPHYSFGDDTIELHTVIQTHDKSIFSGEIFSTKTGRLSAVYSRSFFPVPQCQLSGTVEFGGEFIIDSGYPASTTWLSTAQLNASFSNNVDVRVYVSRNNVPYDPMWNDSIGQVGDKLSSAYYRSGAEASWQMSHVGLFAGYAGTYYLDSSRVAQNWPLGIAPYQMPWNVYVLGAHLGPFAGLTLSPKIHFSDTKPFVKSECRLSFQKMVASGNELLSADLIATYWSPRDRIEFGGIDDWGNETIDLSLNMGVQIKSFRLFYKMNNLLNRKISYVPGYFLPGLTFRWGFHWIIPG